MPRISFYSCRGHMLGCDKEKITACSISLSPIMDVDAEQAIFNVHNLLCYKQIYLIIKAVIYF